MGSPQQSAVLATAPAAAWPRTSGSIHSPSHGRNWLPLRRIPWRNIADYWCNERLSGVVEMANLADMANIGCKPKRLGCMVPCVGIPPSLIQPPAPKA